MQTTLDKRAYTYKDYAALPEGAPCQLIGGELIMTPSPVTKHQIILMKLGTGIANYVMSKKLGLVLFAPMDVYLDEEDTYQPDIIFISNERSNIIGEKKIEGAPDFVAEILSPATAYYDLREKFRKYEKHGVMEYWIVDPHLKTIELYANQNGKFTLIQSVDSGGSCASRIIGGLEIAAKDVFGKAEL